MFVAIIRLRFRGRRLPKPALKRAEPLRGYLVLEERRAVLVGSLEGRAPVIGPLYDASVTKIRNGNFLVAGSERVGVIFEEFPQVWWCRVLEQPCTA